MSSVLSTISSAFSEILTNPEYLLAFGIFLLVLIAIL